MRVLNFYLHCYVISVLFQCFFCFTSKQIISINLEDQRKHLKQEFTTVLHLVKVCNFKKYSSYIYLSKLHEE